MHRVLLLVVAAAAAWCLPVSAVAEESAKGLAALDFRQVIQQSKRRVFPAVVYIKCLRSSMEQGKQQNQEVSGSGVVISAKGELLTNWHVIDKAKEVRCLLSDGRAFDAEVVGSDKELDLALVQLKLPKDTKPLTWAELGKSSKLSEGDFVMAMGAPWGLNRSVSIGIVSCTNRFLPEASEYSLWLQTDAAISPGNSGGPLVSTDGQVIGINTRGVMYGGDMGFALPSDVIAQVLPRMREHGSVQWSWTGLRLQAIRDFNRDVYFDFKEGLIVASTDPESPARRAGIRDHDRILSIDGKAVTAMTEEALPAVRRRIGLIPIGNAVKLKVQRGEETLWIRLTPRQKGKVEGEELDCPRWDFTAKTINQFDNPNLYFYRKTGVFIYGVKRPGNASNAGLREQDVIVKIGSDKITSLDEVKAVYKQAMKDVKNKPKLMIQVLRGGLMRQIILDFSRDYERD